MISRYLGAVLALTFVAMGAHAQRDFFGPVTSVLSAGDLAPELSFQKILSAPDNKTWIPADLFGQITVLAFLPNISSNPRLVEAANALVGQFAGQPVQFVWITQEEEPSLAGWLADHPLKGFVLLDSTGVTGRSYGLGLPAMVFIGADGRIIGFSRAIIPTTDMLEAVLEGRVTTTPPKPGPAELRAFVESHQLLLEAHGPRLANPDDNRPNFPPSNAVHISPSQRESGTGNFGADSWHSFQGFDLKGMISEIYGITPVRIELPASLSDGSRYDFSLVLPQTESRETMYQRFQQGIQDYVHLTATRESRRMDVYVVTALDDRRPPAVSGQPDSGGGFISISIGFESLARTGDPYDFEGMPKTFSLSAVTSISMEGTAEEFCKTLERSLDRPVVNETDLQGRFEFRVDRSATSNGDFLARLRDELGLIIEPAERDVQLLVFNPR
jgi:uncharacterized protein (TIGR03435 family)